MTDANQLAQQLKDQHEKDLAAKQQEYAEKGKKPFELPDHGAGVVPQDYFDTLRSPEDPDYKKGFKHAK